MPGWVMSPEEQRRRALHSHGTAPRRLEEHVVRRMLRDCKLYLTAALHLINSLLLINHETGAKQKSGLLLDRVAYHQKSAA
jgi:hypothetical protein